ncbi:glutaminyl-peptide cyclotransferase [[Eubacterium] cellulosolvens]
MNSFGKIFVIGLFALISIIIIYYALNPKVSMIFTNSINTDESRPIQINNCIIVNAYPHDQNAYTQGLVFDNGYLYEGTGLYGNSTLRKVDLDTGRIIKIRELPDEIFGEGITVYDNRIIQLTWRSNIGYIYDKESFKLLEVFNYSIDGWGITHNGSNIIISNGTSTLHIFDPKTFKKIGEIEVFDDKGPVSNINELEYVKGEIYANIWKTERIARIDPETGQVLGWIELEGLMPDFPRNSEAVFNGIAYDAEQDRLFVTGKLFPKIFEIELT